jgi:glutathione peroxidase
VLGFPCNQFGHQEPGDARSIQDFCTRHYEISFPLFEKIAVNGAHTHPLYGWLKHEKPGFLGSKSIKWNFTKFLLGRDGQVIARYAPTVTPDSLKNAIVQACTTAPDKGNCV